MTNPTQVFARILCRLAIVAPVLGAAKGKEEMGTGGK